MKTFLKILGIAVLVVLLLAGGGYAWAAVTTHRLRSRTMEARAATFPVPFPLDSAEVASLGLTPRQARDSARARALRRGEHLVEARYGCTDCHGQDFGGGVMVDNPMIGHIRGPNLTTGRGSVTRGFGPSDWDRIVRHGVKADGTPAAMPSGDFQSMSDQELSDIIVYIRSLPPVDDTVPPVKLGPLGTVLVATKKMPLSADLIPPDAPHPRFPPAAEANVEFGKHLAAGCTGCHGSDLAGGPIPGGDPSWPPAQNLTPGPAGIGSWSYDDFLTAVREGKRPDGTELRDPMTRMLPYVQNMTDVETRALWMYLRSVPSVPAAG